MTTYIQLVLVDDQCHLQQKRLADSKVKFQEYEKALDDCEELLNGAEITLAEGDFDGQSIDELNGALAVSKVGSYIVPLLSYVGAETLTLLNCMQELVGKLNDEKAALQEAVQGCLEAQASLSRPSSPEALPASMLIPERETNMKIRLEDDIGQVSYHALKLHIFHHRHLCYTVKWADSEDKYKHIV